MSARWRPPYSRRRRQYRPGTTGEGGVVGSALGYFVRVRDGEPTQPLRHELRRWTDTRVYHREVVLKLVLSHGWALSVGITLGVLGQQFLGRCV